MLIAFLPAAIIGALAHDFIKTVLFETPKLICIMLIVGGVVLLLVDRLTLNPRYHDVDGVSAGRPISASASSSAWR